MTFKDVVSKLLQLLEIGEIDWQNNLGPFSYCRTITDLQPYEQLIIQTLDTEVRALIDGGHYTYDQRLTPADIEHLYNLFVRQIKRAKVHEGIPDEFNQDYRDQALACLEEIRTSL